MMILSWILLVIVLVWKFTSELDKIKYIEYLEKELRESEEREKIADKVIKEKNEELKKLRK